MHSRRQKLFPYQRNGRRRTLRFRDVYKRQVATCDPKVIPDAPVLTWLDYKTALEISNQGAKVLHPRAVEILYGKGIPLIAVSYTHLDVYKRQGLHRAGALILLI